MNAVLQFGAGYRTYIIAAVLVLVVVVEKGLGIDVPGVDVGSDWLTQILAALGLAPCGPGSPGRPSDRLVRSGPHRRGGPGHRGDLRRWPQGGRSH